MIKMSLYRNMKYSNGTVFVFLSELTILIEPLFILTSSQNILIVYYLVNFFA